MTDRRRDYIEYVGERMNKPENKGSSFTMWKALYDFCAGWSWTLYDLGIEDQIDDYITYQSWANRERVEWLSDIAKLEIVDISVLQEIGEQIEDDINEEDKQEVFDELDSYHFVERSEVVGAIENYFYPTSWDKGPSYWELAIYTERADEYIDDRGLEFDEEEE